MQRIVQISNYQIKYTLLIKNVKNINMRIEKSGEIVVSCNSYIPIEKVDAFVMSKFEWIVKNVEQVKRKKKILEDQSSYLYLGKKYLVEIVESKFNGAKFHENKLIVYKTENVEVERIIQAFEKEVATKYFKKIMKLVFEKMSYDYPIVEPTLKIRNMTSRWGSCMPSKNQITLNLQLIHYDEKFIEYVVYHEYAHLIQPNHSKAFYRVIEKYMPDYKKISENGPKLMTIDDENMI